MDTIDSDKLDAPSDAVTVILEDAKLLQKVQVFRINSNRHSMLLDTHNAKLIGVLLRLDKGVVLNNDR